MEDPKRTAAEARASAELLDRLAEQDRFMTARRAGGGAMPEVGEAGPETPTLEVELDLDADVVKWFKALGAIWPARLNAVLRIYAREAWR
jgi:uncharacterized protein (DUF4415 family)